MTRWGKFVAAGCVAMLAISACTAEPDSGAEKSIVEHPRAKVPKDRDPKAVLAAVRQLDLCALLGPAIAATPGLPATTVGRNPLAPFNCEARAETYGSFNVRVEVASMSSDDRRALPMRPLGGAKVYLWGGAPTEACDADLPISFREVLKVRLQWKAPPVDPCTTVESLAASMVTTLADPAGARVTPRWDACGVLRAALPKEKVSTSEIAMDVCGTDDFRHHFGFSLILPSLEEPRLDAVAGVEVKLVEERDEDNDDAVVSCSLFWTFGPPPPGAAEDHDGLYALVTAKDCEGAKDFAPKVMEVLKTPPPAKPAPQSPLLYRADEPDMPFPGACAWLQPSNGMHCEPYVEVPVPDGRAAVLSAAKKDPNVHCAIAIAAVAKHLGPQFVPVTRTRDKRSDGRGDCVFVEPERQVHAEITLWEDPVAGPHDRPPGDKAEVPGHAGYQKLTEDRFEMWLGLSANGEDRGTLRFYLTDGPAGAGTNPFGAYVDKIAPMMTEILATHVS